MKLKTDRLKLREFNQPDAGKLAELLDNIEITKNLAVVPHPYSLEEAEDFIERCQKKAEKEPRKGYNFAIELKDSGELIGSISIDRRGKDEEVGVLGYWLEPEHWRNGYMSEALQKILEFGFDDLKLRRIEAEAHTENNASQKLLEKFDFKREGTRREAQRVEANGEVRDEDIYGLLSKNFS